MVDIGHKSDLLRMDHDRLMELVDGMFDRHSPKELQAAYPNIGYGTAAALAKIETNPALSEEFDRSVVSTTSDTVAFMRSVPLPT